MDLGKSVAKMVLTILRVSLQFQLLQVVETGTSWSQELKI